MKDVGDIIREHLENNGYDGLYSWNVECACFRDCLVPCEADPSMCVPGYKSTVYFDGEVCDGISVRKQNFFDLLEIRKSLWVSEDLKEFDKRHPEVRKYIMLSASAGLTAERRAPEGTDCECCGHTTRTVTMEDSRTMYDWDGVGEDPNRAKALCSMCAIEHHEYWDDMWDQYYQGGF